MKKRFDIRVMDQELSILSDREEEYVERVVQFVNERAQETRKAIKNGTDLGIAILVALNIADELFETCEQLQKDVDQMESRAAKLIDYITTKGQM